MPTQTKPALPFAPYEGAGPYIFVSYAHANADKVYPIIKRLHEMGYRMWYDRGIPPSAVWMETIMRHLDEAKYVLLFVTPEAIVSDYVFTEVSVARDKRPATPLCPVYLAETKLSDRFRGYLHILQSVFCYEYSSEGEVLEEITRGLPPDARGSQPKVEPKPEPAKPVQQKVKQAQSTKQVTVPLPQPEPTPPSPSPASDFDWKIELDGTATVVKYNGTDSDIVIPSRYQGKQVSKIGDRAFKDNKHSISVIIPEGVSEIRKWAFDCIFLTDITMPSSICSIAYQAFSTYGQPRNDNLTFHCSHGSCAEYFAKKHNININYTD